MKKIILFLILIFLINCKFCFCDSLYNNLPFYKSFFSDKQPKRIGDLITVVISENTKATGKAETKTNKSGSLTEGPGTSGIFDYASKEKYEGTGVTTRSGALSGRITVRVIDILPNGSLKVEGTSVLTINKEKQTITISGIVRPEDINYNNTVYSYNIADGQIKYDGKGPLGRKQKEGIIRKIFGWIF